MRFPQRSKALLRRLGWLTAGCLWLGGIGAGLTLLAWHAAAVGNSGPAPRRWPTASHIPLSDHTQTLIMFAHPRCPCTRASLGELEKILARCPDNVTPWVVFFKPSGTPETWDQTDQWFAAAAIPGVHVLRDVDGVEARLFNAMTSGQTLLYSPAGELLFDGGTTFARGHAGDNAGRSAIESLLNNSTPDTRQTPVYGCPIIIPSERN
jgi:hypothetical protein